jgi:hypothetical protein
MRTLSTLIESVLGAEFFGGFWMIAQRLYGMKSEMARDSSRGSLN